MLYAALNVVVALVAFAIINRLRGFRDWQPKWMKGRPLFYMSGVVFLYTFHVWPTITAAMFTAAYFFWGVLPWGRWYDVGALPDDYTGPPSLFERAIEAVSFGSDFVALVWRHSLIMPGLMAVGYLVGYPFWVTALLSLWFGLMVAIVYSVCRMIRPDAHTIPAEYVVGVLWGVIFNLMWGLT